MHQHIARRRTGNMIYWIRIFLLYFKNDALTIGRTYTVVSYKQLSRHRKSGCSWTSLDTAGWQFFMGLLRHRHIPILYNKASLQIFTIKETKFMLGFSIRQWSTNLHAHQPSLRSWGWGFSLRNPFQNFKPFKVCLDFHFKIRSWCLGEVIQDWILWRQSELLLTMHRIGKGQLDSGSTVFECRLSAACQAPLNHIAHNTN